MSIKITKDTLAFAFVALLTLAGSQVLDLEPSPEVEEVQATELAAV